MVPPTDGRVPILFLFHILGVDAEAEVDRKCTNTQGREAVLLAVPSYDKYALPRALKKIPNHATSSAIQIRLKNVPKSEWTWLCMLEAFASWKATSQQTWNKGVPLFCEQTPLKGHKKNNNKRASRNASSFRTTAGTLPDMAGQGHFSRAGTQ